MLGRWSTLCPVSTDRQTEPEVATDGTDRSASVPVSWIIQLRRSRPRPYSARSGSTALPPMVFGDGYVPVKISDHADQLGIGGQRPHNVSRDGSQCSQMGHHCIVDGLVADGRKHGNRRLLTSGMHRIQGRPKPHLELWHNGVAVRIRGRFPFHSDEKSHEQIDPGRSRNRLNGIQSDAGFDDRARLGYGGSPQRLPTGHDSFVNKMLLHQLVLEWLRVRTTAPIRLTASIHSFCGSGSARISVRSLVHRVHRANCTLIKPFSFSFMRDVWIIFVNNRLSEPKNGKPGCLGTDGVGPSAGAAREPVAILRTQHIMSRSPDQLCSAHSRFSCAIPKSLKPCVSAGWC
jgi:hypothetical protein